jgi:hypothetical protein
MKRWNGRAGKEEEDKISQLHFGACGEQPDSRGETALFVSRSVLGKNTTKYINTNDIVC